jgi:hypothetical protein
MRSLSLDELAFVSGGNIWRDIGVGILGNLATDAVKWLLIRP